MRYSLASDHSDFSKAYFQANYAQLVRQMTALGELPGMEVAWKLNRSMDILIASLAPALVRPTVAGDCQRIPPLVMKVQAVQRASPVAGTSLTMSSGILASILIKIIQVRLTNSAYSDALSGLAFSTLAIISEYLFSYDENEYLKLKC